MQEELDALADIAGHEELGNLTLAAERAREAWGWPWNGVVADIRYAFRAMRKNPGFTAVAVVTLALGMGANSAMFSFGDAILFKPLPVMRPSEIVRVSSATPNDSQEGMSYPDYRDLRRESHSFSRLAAYRSTTVGVGAAAMPPRIRQALLVSDNFFSTLGVAPFLGRTLSAGERDARDRDPIVILGYDFWAAEFRASRSVIGQTLRVNRVEFTIVGVAPKSFSGMDRFFPPSVFVPLLTWDRLEGAKEDPIEDRARHELEVVGRLKAGVSQETAQVELAALGQDLQRAYPKTNANRRIAVRSELEAIIAREPVRLAMVALLMTLAGVVLMIACANVANLGLARARARRCEIAVRLSIGAGEFRLLRQLSSIGSNITSPLAVAIRERFPR